MKQTSKQKWKKALIILPLFFLPALTLLFLSKAHHSFDEPPFIGEPTYSYDDNGKVIDTIQYTIPDFEFKTTSGELINKKSIGEKYIIFTTIQNECVYAEDLHQHCSIYPYHIEELVYGDFFGVQSAYKDVRIISIVTDSLGRSVEASPALKKYFSDKDEKIWTLVEGDPHQVYHFKVHGKYFDEVRKDGYLGRLPFLRSMLLIDKEYHIRGYFGGKTQTEIREFMDRLSVLIKNDSSK